MVKSVDGYNFNDLAWDVLSLSVSAGLGVAAYHGTKWLLAPTGLQLPPRLLKATQILNLEWYAAAGTSGLSIFFTRPHRTTKADQQRITDLTNECDTARSEAEKLRPQASVARQVRGAVTQEMQRFDRLVRERMNTMTDIYQANANLQGDLGKAVNEMGARVETALEQMGDTVAQLIDRIEALEKRPPLRRPLRPGAFKKGRRGPPKRNLKRPPVPQRKVSAPLAKQPPKAPPKKRSSFQFTAELKSKKLTDHKLRKVPAKKPAPKNGGPKKALLTVSVLKRGKGELKDEKEQTALNPPPKKNLKGGHAVMNQIKKGAALKKTEGPITRDWRKEKNNGGLRDFLAAGLKLFRKDLVDDDDCDVTDDEWNDVTDSELVDTFVQKVVDTVDEDLDQEGKDELVIDLTKSVNQMVKAGPGTKEEFVNELAKSVNKAVNNGLENCLSRSQKK